MADNTDANREAEQVKPKTEADLTTSALAGAQPAGPANEERANEERSFAPSAQDAQARRDEAPAPLFSGDESAQLRKQWDAIQSDFVDEPRRAVEKADNLVAQAMKRLAEMFAEERARLETQWNRGENVETEDLRIALQRYRSFFSRLLSV